MGSDRGDLTAEQAVEIARAHLAELGLERHIADRTVEVSSVGSGFEVVFEPPANVRGGPFTVTVGSDGQVTDQRFER